MYIRRRLISLVGLSLLPVLIFSTVMTAIFWRQQRLAFEQQFLERVRAMTLALDRTLEGSTTLLQALASSPELDRGDFRAFYERAQRVASAEPHWATVALIDPATGREILNLRHPVGEPSNASVASLEAFQRTLATRAPAVSGLVQSPPLHALSTAVFVPVIREATIRYVLYAAIDQDVWLRFLSSYPVATGATMTLVDLDGTVIARTLNNDRWVGRRLTPSQLESSRRIAEGADHSVGLEGQSFYGAHSRSRIAGWTVGTGVPTRSVEAALWWSTFGVIVGAGLSMVLAVVLAVSFGAGITQPVTRLVARVRALATDQRPPTLPRTGIRELDEVAQAFDETGRLLEEQDRERAELLRRERAARAEAEAARIEAEAGNHAKDEFLAMLGHELRNPLGAIGTAVHVLEFPGAAADHRAGAQGVIKRQVAHLTRLVNDLLEASRIATGKIVLDCGPMNLEPIVRRCLATIEAGGRTQSYRVDLDLQPAWANADDTRIEQVVTNLLTNAFKYTPSGGRVAISLRTEGDDVVFRVSDSGVGIAPEMLRRVFDLFVQGDRTLERSQGGLGIGLTLARRIVELHGGTVTAESAGTGQGSTFTVRLPRVSPLIAAQPKIPVLSRERPRRILVIEDNADAREMLCEALQSAGHDVHQAVDGPGGVEAAGRLAPDVVLIDIGLPGLDGYAAARCIRQAAGLRPLLIAVTGYGRPEDRERALQAGFDLHLTKPVDPFQLLQLIYDGAAASA